MRNDFTFNMCRDRGRTECSQEVADSEECSTVADPCAPTGGECTESESRLSWQPSMSFLISLKILSLNAAWSNVIGLD